MLYRQIILEWGQDTESGVWGLGYSPDNGKNFYVLNTTHGRKYRAEDGNRLYPYISDQVQDKIETVVAPAKSAADSAQSAADAAVASAQVTSDAVSAIASATAEAKQGANDALSRAKSAWDVATGAKEAVTNFDPLLKSAQSDASKALTQIADTASALSDAKTEFNSGVAEAKNLASTAQTTANNAVKSASSVADDLTTVANQAKANANGITKVTSDVGSLQTIVADNSGNISTIQETAKQIQQAVSDNAGNITVAKQTADSAITVASDARSNATVASQTASQASITAQNASGQAASAVLTANGAMTTASDAKSDATVAIQTASGASLTATNAQGDASIAKQTASEAKVQASNAESDFAQLSVRANKIETNVANNSGAIASVQQTANGLTTTVGNVDNRVKTIEDKTNWITQTGPLDMNTLTTTQNIYYRDTNLKNADGEAGWAYIQVISIGERVTQTVWHDRSSIQHTRTGAVSGSSYNWDAWNTVATNAQVVQVKNTVDGISTTINDPKTGLNATYQTAAGNATTISNVKSDVYQLQTTASGLTSRVGNLESKTNTQETAIEQNKNAIALKADQTDVNTLKGNVTSLQAEVTTQANEITTKVTQSDVTGMLTGYATQDYTQSLVTQKANDWNLNLTSLKTDVNAIKTNGGGVNLLQGTRDFSGSNWLNLGTIWTKTDETYNGLSVVETTHDWAGIAQYYQVKQGETYIFSLFARYTSGTGTSNFYIGLNSDPENGYKNAQVDNGALTCSLDTNWKKYSITFTAKADGYIKPRMERTNANTNPLRVCGFMLEKGTVAHDWSPAPSDMATVTSVTNLSATVDGIKSTVANYQTDTSSHFTQLSNLIQSKVGTDDFNSLKQTVGLQTLESADIDSMNKNGHYFVHNLTNSPISGWVYVDITGNGIDRIRQDVYQDTGTKHKYRRWFGTSFTDWEEGATYTEINQLQDAINLRVTKGDLISQINLQAGTALIQSNKLVLDGKTTVITGEAFIPSAAISSIQADKIQIGNSQLFSDDGTFNLINQNAGTSSIKLTTGNVQGSTQPVTKFANGYNLSAIDISPVGTVIRPTLFFEDYPGQAKDTGWLGFSRHQTAELYFHTYDDTKELFRVACVSRFNQELHVDKPIWQQGLSIDSGNTIWSGSNFLAIGDHISNSYTNVMAKSFSQQSTLSSKTNIETVDPKDALDLVNRTDILSYQYTTDVAQGKTKRYTSMILDDVHDVSQYYAPDEFANEERTGRDDGSAVGYLFLAVKELTRRIKILEEKLNG